ncbi:hypothetical protein NL676_004191 [Syzygium grande]|nr:hypothetical protein NL676_004191 [Syzygium grande]
MLARTPSSFTFSGSLNRRANRPLLRSTRCHLSAFSSCSLRLSPLICSTLPSSTSTFTSSFFSPGRSTLNTCDSGVSFQSIRAFAMAVASRSPPEGWTAATPKPSKGSHMSREKGSKTPAWRPTKKLGTSDMVYDETLMFRWVWCFSREL